MFEEPVFGSEAGKVPEDQRVEAIQSMMKNVFECARHRGMKINFALDFDFISCNPQDMILQLSESDRFIVNGTWLARPDTAAGYEFYKAQAKAMVAAYPQVGTLTLWLMFV